MSAHPTPIQAAAQLQANTLFASLELSKARWLVTVSAPGSDKLSRHQVPGGDGQALLELLWRLQAAAGRRTGAPVAIVVIQEAGLDGFWDPPPAGSERDYKPCRRCGLNRGQPAPPPRQ